MGAGFFDVIVGAFVAALAGRRLSSRGAEPPSTTFTSPRGPCLMPHAWVWCHVGSGAPCGACRARHADDVAGPPLLCPGV